MTLALDTLTSQRQGSDWPEHEASEEPLSSLVFLCVQAFAQAVPFACNIPGTHTHTETSMSSVESSLLRSLWF